MSAEHEVPTLWGLFRRHLGAYLAGGVVLAVFQLAMNRIDWLSKAAIDGIFGSDPRGAWRPAELMLALAVVAFFTRVASRYYIFNAGRDVEYEVRTALLRRLHALGSSFYRKVSAGDIMSRATNDLMQVRLLYGFGILNVINVLFAFASAFQVMATISLRLTLVSFVGLPVLLVITRSFGRSLYVRQRENQLTLAGIADVIQKSLAGVRVVRSFALEDEELGRFRKANDAYLEASLGLARLRGSMGPIMGAVSAVSVLLFFWYGAALLVRGPEAGGISRGDFFAFSSALARMTWPMVALGFSLTIVQRGRAGFARLEEVFAAKPDIEPATKPWMGPVRGHVVVQNLSFSHGDTAVLRNVSFEVEPGKSVAIVGRTGSGKSTLLCLLARLLPTPRGTVTVDGVDVCDVDLGVLRRSIGYAQQDAFLFSTTVTRNVGFPLDDPDAAEVQPRIALATREAQVESEVTALPEQFDTVVGERGVQLSGGQKQRIALARALVSEPIVLLLDDPLSAVDAKTEAAILGAIDRQAEKRSVVLVTHRVAAASRCDKIVVLDEGAVVEQGTHDELVSAGGVYARFAEEQRVAGELEEMPAEAGAA
jgi:ATP-binding cassette subfamily B protein